MEIVILDAYSANPGDLSWDALNEFGTVTIYDRTPKNVDEVVKRIGNAEVVIENKVNMSREVMDRCPNLRFIGELATGYNNIDIAAAKENGIVVANVPAYSTMSVAQTAMGLLLEITHHVGHHTHLVLDENAWVKNPDNSWFDKPLIELDGKTMGIIGFGAIGQAVGRAAKAFGMNVIAYSRSVREEAKSIGEYVSLDELLARADVISLHCPLFPETKGIINHESIAKMKDGVIILNTSRGPLIDEQALVDALESGKVYAAGVDVISEEPMVPGNPLLKAKNLVITPHLAWMTKEARSRLLQITVDNLRAWRDGKPQNNVAA